jgi:hypothetical protein
LLLLLLAAWPAPAGAETGTVYPFPQLPPGKKPRHNLSIDVDVRGVHANGYRPVKIKVMNTPNRTRTPVPVTADRQVRIVLKPNGWGHMASVEVSQVIEIPEKQASAEATIALCQSGECYQYEMEVYEGGEKLEELSGYISLLFSGRTGDNELTPAILLVSSHVPDAAKRWQITGGTFIDANPTYRIPDFRTLLEAIPMSPVGGGGTIVMSGAGAYSDAALISHQQQYDKFRLLRPDELPTRWIELSQHDVAIISLEELEQMARQNARQRQALLDWLHGGPTLVVYGVGDDFDRLAEVEKLLKLPPLTGAENKLFRGWRAASESDRGEVRNYSSYNNVYRAAPAIAAPSPAPPTNIPPPAARPAGQPLFVSRPAQLGWVIAIGTEKAFPGTHADWSWVISSIPAQREQWMKRHGMSLEVENEDFWNWHIPGVGAAPVFGFLALATLFAVVIGPVNYLLLGRIGRLYLLLITVPVGAALVTLFLFGYAILSDGLGVRARVRSFSLLDQQNQRTWSWSRQTYYASLVPSKGLVYPDDTAVFPLVHHPEQYARPGSNRYRVHWEGNQQRLAAGFLRSRTLTQFLGIRAAPSKLRLEVAESVIGQSPPKVANQLQTRVRRLVLRGRSGDYFWAEDGLEIGEATSLKPISAADARKLVAQVLADNKPAFPEGYDPSADSGRGGFFWNVGWWGQSSVRPDHGSSILESNLRSLEIGPGDLLEPGTYCAVVERAPDVPLGIENVTEEMSLHVVIGRW